MDIDKAETVLAVGLANNAIALRSLEEAGPPSLLFLPLGQEERQRAHPVAISPDGARLAYGVPPNTDNRGFAKLNTARIYIVDRLNGRVTSEISNLSSRAQEIRFSPDGKFLAAVLSSGCGLRVWRTEDWKEYGRDDEDHAGDGRSSLSCSNASGPERIGLPDTHSLTFTSHPSVWLLTAGMTGVRSYVNTGSGVTRYRHRSAIEVGLQVPDGIAVSPDGTKFAVGDRRALSTAAGPVRLSVAVLRVDDLMPAASAFAVRDEDLDFPDRLNTHFHSDARQFNLAKVGWLSVDNEDWVVGAGAFPCIASLASLRYGSHTSGARDLCAVAWPFGKEGRPRFLPVGTDQVIDVATLHTKRAFVFLSNRSLAAQHIDGTSLTLRGNNADSKAVFKFASTSADFRDRTNANGEGLKFLVSDDADVVYFEDYRQATDSNLPLSFDLKSLTLRPSTVAALALNAAVVDGNVTGDPDRWLNSPTPPLLAGNAIKSLVDSRDIYRALTILPEGKLAIASANYIHVVGRDQIGSSALCSLRIQDEGFRINSSKDGRILVVAHGDGVIRWYRVDHTGATTCNIKNVLAVHFQQIGEKADWSWVAWRPETGEFASDGRARNTLSWEIPDKNCTTQIVRFGTLTSDLYDAKAIQSALTSFAPSDASSDFGRKIAQFCELGTFSVTSPKQRSRVSSEIVQFELTIANVGASSKLFVALGSGERLAKINEVREYLPDEGMPVAASVKTLVGVRLPSANLRPNTDFHVCFYVGEVRQCHPLRWDGAPPPVKKRRLWVVAAGVSMYGRPNEIADLQFAQNDALDLVKIFASDFKRQHLPGVALDAADYDALSLHLLISSPLNDFATRDVRAIAGDTLIKVQKIDRDELMGALDRVAAAAGRDPNFEDVFIFFFSGHGSASPFGKAKGSSTFLLPSGPGAQPFPTIPVSSGELLERFAKINAHKLMIFDACRTILADPSAQPFDAAKVRSEFEDALTSAYMIFSASPGETSIESAQHAFDQNRNEAIRGNGVFSFALLNSLTSKDADSKSISRLPGRITVDESVDYIKDTFLQRRSTSILFKQQPIHVPWRSGATLVLRTLH